MTNEHGVAARDRAEVTTRNVAPTVDDVQVRAGRAGRTVYLTATASDPGMADTHAATVDWGDGVVEPARVDQSPGGVTLRARHRYAAARRYEVTLRVRDDDDGTDTWTGEIRPRCEQRRRHWHRC